MLTKINLNMPMVDIVKKDGSEIIGVPVGFLKRNELDEETKTNKLKYYIIFSFEKVNCEDISAVYTFDDTRCKRGSTVNTAYSAFTTIFNLNRDIRIWG